MRKDAQAVALLLLGGTLLKISITGTYVRYVRPGLLPLLVISGVVLIVIAGVTLWQVMRGPKAASTAPAKVTRKAARIAKADDEAALEPSGFEDLAEDRESAQRLDPETERPEVPATAEAETAKPDPIEEAPRPEPAKPDLTTVHELEPMSLSALRDPERAPRPASRDIDQAAMAALRDQQTTALPALATRKSVGEPVAPEVTYREFTPGELVAVPVGHHLVDRAAHERVREAKAAALAGVAVAVADEPDEPDEHPDLDHAHRHDEPRVAWLLLLPALALLLFAPPALGSYQASRNGTALSSQADSDFPPLPAGDPVRISLLDYAGRAVFDEGRSLQGRQVTLSGFIIAGPEGQPYLARMVVTCCAADGRPVKVGLAGDLPSTLKPDQWLEVVGTYDDRADKDPVNAELVPYLQVTSVHMIAAPSEQYES